MCIRDRCSLQEPDRFRLLWWFARWVCKPLWFCVAFQWNQNSSRRSRHSWVAWGWTLRAISFWGSHHDRVKLRLRLPSHLSGWPRLCLPSQLARWSLKSLLVRSPYSVSLFNMILWRMSSKVKWLHSVTFSTKLILFYLIIKDWFNAAFIAIILVKN